MGENKEMAINKNNPKLEKEEVIDIAQHRANITIGEIIDYVAQEALKKVNEAKAPLYKRLWEKIKKWL